MDNDILGIPDYIWLYGIFPAFIFNIGRQYTYQKWGAKEMKTPIYWYMQIGALCFGIFMNYLVKPYWVPIDIQQVMVKDPPAFQFYGDHPNMKYSAFEALSYDRELHEVKNSLFINVRERGEESTYKVFKKDYQPDYVTSNMMADFLGSFSTKYTSDNIPSIGNVEIHDEYAFVDQNVFFSKDYVFVKWFFTDYRYDSHWKLDRSEMDCPYSMKPDVGFLSANKYQKSSFLCPFDREILLTYHTGLGIDWTIKSYARFSIFHSLLGVHYIAAAAHLINKHKSFSKITKKEFRYLQASLGIMIVTGWRQAYQMCMDPLTALYTLQPTGMWSIGIAGIGIGVMATEMQILISVKNAIEQKHYFTHMSMFIENYQYIVLICGGVYALRSELWHLNLFLLVVWLPGILCMMRSQFYMVMWSHNIFTDPEEKVITDLFWRIMVVFPIMMVSATMNVRSIPNMEPMNVIAALLQCTATLFFATLYYPDAEDAQYSNLRLIFSYPRKRPSRELKVE